ncbi:MAG: Hsp33 family molecular chaperone HslO [bacterium]
MSAAKNGDRVGEATIRRFIDRERDLIVARGDFGPLFAAYLDHARRWDAEPDPLSQTFMRQGLGAAALQLASRPKGESIGWTIQIHEPPTNVFLTGESSDAIVTGRVFTRNVRPADRSRMYVQSTRVGGRTSGSTIEVFGLDILEMFEQYYRLSEQAPARFLEIDDESFLMLRGLPDVDHGWLAGLSREEAIGLAEDELHALGETKYRFQCGCNPARMMEVVQKMFREEPSELFRGDSGVEISCPRCGRRWWIDKAAFDAAGGASGSSGPNEPNEPGEPDEPRGPRGPSELEGGPPAR